MPDVFGDDAIPLLRELARTDPIGNLTPCQDAFAACGEIALPVLCEMVREKSAPAAYRACARAAIASICSQRAREPLFELAATAGRELAMPACQAPWGMGGDDLEARFLAMLAKGTNADVTIANYFKVNPRRAALPVIDAALDRLLDLRVRAELLRAREACARAPEGSEAGGR